MLNIFTVHLICIFLKTFFYL